MSDFIDLLSDVPFAWAALAVAAGLLLALVLYMSDGEHEEPDDELYTAERATVAHLERIRRERIRQAHQDLRGHR